MVFNHFKSSTCLIHVTFSLCNIFYKNREKTPTCVIKMWLEDTLFIHILKCKQTKQKWSVKGYTSHDGFITFWWLCHNFYIFYRDMKLSCVGRLTEKILILFSRGSLIPWCTVLHNLLGKTLSKPELFSSLLKKIQNVHVYKTFCNDKLSRVFCVFNVLLSLQLLALL